MLSYFPPLATDSVVSIKLDKLTGEDLCFGILKDKIINSFKITAKYYLQWDIIGCSQFCLSCYSSTSTTYIWIEGPTAP